MIEITVNQEKVPALGFGTWQLRGKQCVEAVEDALEIGYRHIDTARMYDNQREVGDAIRTSGVQRSDIFLTTKLWPSELAPRDARKAIEDSLRTLRTDYVDLLLIHWPNERIPLEQTLEAMQEMCSKGETRLIGVSNFSPVLFHKALSYAPIACNQVEYHPFLAQNELIRIARQHGAFLTAYSPVARGRVNGEEVLRKIGSTHGKNAVQVALRWLIQQDRVGAIPKAASKEHRRLNFDIFDFELTDDEMDRIAGLANNTRLVDPP